MTEFTLGVEEEFHLVDARTRDLRAAAPDVLSGRGHHDEAEPELLASQVEFATPICSTLAEVRHHLVRQRRELAVSAEGAGCRLAASGSYPAAYRAPEIMPGQRYDEIVDRFGPVAREQVVCGCHVHVGVGHADLAVSAMNRARPWLAVLLALSGNSPFWRGEDTGYASYRTQVWSQWPSSGPPSVFQSRAEYEAVMRSLVDAGVLRDLGMVYWDVRPSQQFDTLEFRVADVCLTVDETVMLAGLTRALARTCVDAARRDGDQGEPVRPELLRVARWRAARSGLSGDLVDVTTGRPVPAAQQVQRLLDHVRPGLEAHGDLDEVTALVSEVFDRGTGAVRQSAVYQRAGDIGDVIDFIVEETVPER